jgi:hypothetical protein
MPWLKTCRKVEVGQSFSLDGPQDEGEKAFRSQEDGSAGRARSLPEDALDFLILPWEKQFSPLLLVLVAFVLFMFVRRCAALYRWFVLSHIVQGSIPMKMSLV